MWLFCDTWLSFFFFLLKVFKLFINSKLMKHLPIKLAI